MQKSILAPCKQNTQCHARVKNIKNQTQWATHTYIAHERDGKGKVGIQAKLVPYQASIYHWKKELGVYLLFPKWDASLSQGYPPA